MSKDWVNDISMMHRKYATNIAVRRMNEEKLKEYNDQNANEYAELEQMKTDILDMKKTYGLDLMAKTWYTGTRDEKDKDLIHYVPTNLKLYSDAQIIQMGGKENARKIIAAINGEIKNRRVYKRKLKEKWKKASLHKTVASRWENEILKLKKDKQYLLSRVDQIYKNQ